MSVTRIATRYAKSLLELAIEQNKLEQVHSDMSSLKKAVAHRELALMLKSPIIQGDKKVAVIKALFRDNFDVLTLAYLELLINKGREMYIPEIVREFDLQYKILKHITSVRIISAAPLSEDAVEMLRSRLLDSKVTSDSLEIETVVDPELIGGFVLEFDDKRYDASIISKLNDLKAAFSKNLYIKEF
jgi:F-type H+-transporting ATPase subunit delta